MLDLVAELLELVELLELLELPERLLELLGAGAVVPRQAHNSYQTGEHSPYL